MSHLLKAKCVARHPRADRTEPGPTRVRATFEVEADGVVGTLNLTITDPLVAAYCQVGKHYELPISLDQTISMATAKESAL